MAAQMGDFRENPSTKGPALLSRSCQGHVIFIKEQIEKQAS